LATVRIYKVAELLGLSSQEAMDLLKKETGIDVKSASSSIEEIVARQFVEKQARKRQIALPHGPMFTDAPVAKRPAAKGKAPEPPKPAAPVLRPRLVKTVRPAEAAVEEGQAGDLGAAIPGSEDLGHHVSAEAAPAVAESAPAHVEAPEIPAPVEEPRRQPQPEPSEPETPAPPAPVSERRLRRTSRRTPRSRRVHPAASCRRPAGCGSKIR
jgi:hypothetical protein